MDKRIQARLYDYALAQGEDKAWLDKLFHAGPDSLVKHARRHRDHFHVRFFASRSQELGRRIQPLLARQPEQNVVIHRVVKGDTLGRPRHPLQQHREADPEGQRADLHLAERGPHPEHSPARALHQLSRSAPAGGPAALPASRSAAQVLKTAACLHGLTR